MTTTAVKERRRPIETRPAKKGPSGEFAAFCPGCKAFETLWLNNGVMTPTPKFHQDGERVFHNCGSAEPVKMYRCG
jgi:hypothetical protein